MQYRKCHPQLPRLPNNTLAGVVSMWALGDDRDMQWSKAQSPQETKTWPKVSTLQISSQMKAVHSMFLFCDGRTRDREIELHKGHRMVHESILGIPTESLRRSLKIVISHQTKYLFANI